MNRLVISNLPQLIGILQRHPSLLALGAFRPIEYVAKQAQEASKACGCNAAKVYNDNRKTFELALDGLGNGDHLIVKNALGIQELCYYTKDNAGRLILKCL